MWFQALRRGSNLDREFVIKIVSNQCDCERARMQCRDKPPIVFDLEREIGVADNQTSSFSFIS